MLRQPERLAYDPWFLIYRPLCIQRLDDVELAVLRPRARLHAGALRRAPAAARPARLVAHGRGRAGGGVRDERAVQERAAMLGDLGM